MIIPKASRESVLSPSPFFQLFSPLSPLQPVITELCLPAALLLLAPGFQARRGSLFFARFCKPVAEVMRFGKSSVLAQSRVENEKSESQAVVSRIWSFSTFLIQGVYRSQQVKFSAFNTIFMFKWMRIENYWESYHIMNIWMAKKVKRT